MTEVVLGKREKKKGKGNENRKKKKRKRISLLLFLSPSFPSLLPSFSTVPLERQRVVPLPGRPPRRPELVRRVPPVPQSAELLPGARQAAELAVLVDRVRDPRHAGVRADRLVGRVDKNDLEVLVGGVLVDPVGVEHAEAREAAAGPLLGDRAEVARRLELRDTLVDGFPVDDPLRDGLLAPPAADADAVDDVALLGLVAHAAGLFGWGGGRKKERGRKR